MTSADRIQAVIASGFTERQARFLEAVLLHSGVCLGRQYLAHRASGAAGRSTTSSRR